MARVLTDTSAIYALLDRSDANHGRARAILEALRQARAQVFLTNFIVAEAHALLAGRLGHRVARQWLRGLAWPVERATEADEARASDIIYAHADQTCSYTDAVSFAVMERLTVSEAYAFDRRFLRYGFRLAGD